MNTLKPFMIMDTVLNGYFTTLHDHVYSAS